MPTEIPPVAMPGRSILLDIDGVALHVVDHSPSGESDASRPSLLLLHGGMAHARWFDALAPLLAPALRPLALDRRGHGDSDWTDPERYGWERDLADIEAVMRRVAPAPWIVAGHSQGGLLAVDLATRRDVPLAALVLLDVPLHPTGPRIRRAGEALTKIPQLRWRSLEDAVRAFKPFPAPHHVPRDRLGQIARASFKRTEDGGWTSKFHWKRMQGDRSHQPSPLQDFAERLGAIAVPTLCLRGAESTILTPEEHREMTTRIRAGRAAEIPGATHNLHAEQPELVAREILAFASLLSAGDGVAPAD